MSFPATNDSFSYGSTRRALLKPPTRAKSTTATNYQIVDFDGSEATALNTESLRRTFVDPMKLEAVPMVLGAVGVIRKGTMTHNVSIESSGIIGPTQRAAQSAKHKIAIKLTELGSLFFEDYERMLSAESVQGLTEFLSALPNPAVPSLAAESSGAIVATWRKGNRCASLKFLDETQFHYALAIETPQGITRPWGTSDRSAFFSKQPHAREIIEQAT